MTGDKSTQKKHNTFDFKQLAEVGSGSYSDISLSRFLENRKLVAIKVVSIKLLKKERKERQANREKEALILCKNCPFVVNLISTFIANFKN